MARKRQETETLNLLHALIAGTEDVVFVKDLEGRYVFVNQAFADFTGLPMGSVIGQTDGAIYDPPLPERFAETDRRVLETGEPYRFEETTTVRGRVRTHIGSKYAYKDADGKPIGILGIARDITERKAMEEALREGEARYRRLVESSPDGIWVNRQGRTLFANPAMARILAAESPQSLVGRFVYDFVRVEDHGEVAARLEAVERLGKAAPAQLRDLVRVDGLVVTTEVAVEPVLWEGERAVQAVVRDVTARLRAEEALRESEERYALAATAANDGLWDWDLRTKEVYYSPRWKAMLGADDETVRPTINEWLSRVHPEDLGRLRAELADHLAGRTDHLESTYRMRAADGSWRWMQSRGLAVRDTDGKPYRIAGSQTDVTERRQAEDQLLHDALHDALTGLPNRALFMEELRLAIDRRRRRPEYGFTVLFLDLDRFKVVNDSLGHLAGDTLLVELARRLTVCLRPGDRVARFGGDEFTVLLDDIDDVAGATRVADRIHAQLVAPFVINGREVFATASVGMALARTGYQDPEAVLRDADLAMYRAKGRGGARYEVFDLGMHATAVARLELETDLARALERGEFRLAYQPVLSGDGARLAGFEALVRWDHPRRGLVDPGHFIDVAEETNLTVRLGAWVLEEALSQLRTWHAEFPEHARLTIGVNVSGKQLLAPGLVPAVARALNESGVAPALVTAEITENVLMQDAETAADVLAALKALGVRIVMDDFGTGYSSLSYLRRFPLDGLKIDRFFVARMDETENLELVRTIISLARSLGLSVVAEGVENAQQWGQLRAMACEYVQGYLFSPPVTAAEAELLLTSHARR